MLRKFDLLPSYPLPPPAWGHAGRILAQIGTRLGAVVEGGRSLRRDSRVFATFMPELTIHGLRPQVSRQHSRKYPRNTRINSKTFETSKTRSVT